MMPQVHALHCAYWKQETNFPPYIILSMGLQVPRASGIYKFHSFLQHSCEPNCAVGVLFSTGDVLVRALRRISAGEVLTRNCEKATVWGEVVSLGADGWLGHLSCALVMRIMSLFWDFLRTWYICNHPTHTLMYISHGTPATWVVPRDTKLRCQVF